MRISSDDIIFIKYNKDIDNVKNIKLMSKIKHFVYF
jgi:hypothetical protein